MNISGIYKIQSKLKPALIYIGSTINIKKRWNDHLSDLRKNKHHSPKLQNHCNKYGTDDLIFIIIEPCFPQFLIIREQYYIDSCNPWFNSTLIAGKRTQFGKKHIMETKLKISLANKGRKRSLEQNANHSKFMTGHITSIETRMKIAKGNTGKIYSKETCEKISKLQMGNKNPLGTIRSEETRKKISQSLTGKRRSAETKLKLSIVNKGKKHTEEHKKHFNETIRLRKLKQNEVA